MGVEGGMVVGESMVIETDRVMAQPLSKLYAILKYIREGLGKNSFLCHWWSLIPDPLIIRPQPCLSIFENKI